MKNTVGRPNKKIIKRQRKLVSHLVSEEMKAAKLESKNSVKVCKINTSIDIVTLKPGMRN